MIDYTVIGKRLQNARKNKNITQDKLAEILDVSTSYISKIESGATKLNMTTISKICDALEVPFSYVLTGSNDSEANYIENINSEINDILKKCSPQKIKLIMSIIKQVSEFEEKT